MSSGWCSVRALKNSFSFGLYCLYCFVLWPLKKKKRREGEKRPTFGDRTQYAHQNKCTQQLLFFFLNLFTYFFFLVCVWVGVVCFCVCFVLFLFFWPYILRLQQLVCSCSRLEFTKCKISWSFYAFPDEMLVAEVHQFFVSNLQRQFCQFTHTKLAFTEKCFGKTSSPYIIKGN